MILLVGCTGANPDTTIPTQVDLPTSEPTQAPTQTAAPTDIPPPTPTELFIPDRVAETPADQAYVRVVNSTSLVGVVDVYIESLAIATNFGVGDYTEREGIVAGSYELRILATGSFLTEPAIYSETLNIFGEQSIIFVISGTIDNIVVTTLLESNEPLANNTSRLMMVNALAGADTATMLVNGTPQTAITPYLQISEPTIFDSQRVTISFQNIGSLILEQVLDLRERQNYTFVIFGQIEQPDTIGLLVLNSRAPGLTDIAIINASQSIGLVDIYFSGELFISGAAYAENSVPEPTLSGTYDISVYPVGANPDEVDPLTGTQFIANPDELIALILMGEPSSLRFVTQRLNPQPTYDNQARIAFINSLESAPSVLLQSTYQRFNEQISYGRSSGLQDIDVEQTYSFTWVEQFEDAQDVAQETFDNFVPRAGNNYVYIFGGRGFDDPMLFSFDVGTLGFETVPEEELEPTPFVTSSPTRLRLVNVWEGREFDVALDGTIIAESIDYETATNSLIINAGSQTVSFLDETLDEDPIVEELTYEFDVGMDYTVVIYNYRDDTSLIGDVLLINDTDAFISSASSGLRLVVLEADAQSLFGLGYSPPLSQITQPDLQEGFRRSLPIGITQIIREIPDEGVSDVQRLPAGPYNIRVIDNEEVAVAYTHIDYTLEPETLYTVFLWENSVTQQTTTIIIPYSTP
jgi:hypothetical protein